MKVLFVCSGNSQFGIVPFIKSQGDSLISKGIDLEYFTIKGNGIKGYLNNIGLLRKHLKLNKYDVIHAHYSLSAFVASLAGCKPLIVSLMGSDVKVNKLWKLFIKFFNHFFWQVCIVKSMDMQQSVSLSEVNIIPNGVNLGLFKSVSHKESLQKLDWKKDRKHILFLANSTRKVKNFSLAKKAFDLLDNSKIELHTLSNVSHEMMPYYFNASDVVILTSLWEGSPNEHVQDVQYQLVFSFFFESFLCIF